jgi:hypothetical protein
MSMAESWYGAQPSPLVAPRTKDSISAVVSSRPSRFDRMMSTARMVLTRGGVDSFHQF